MFRWHGGVVMVRHCGGAALHQGFSVQAGGGADRESSQSRCPGPQGAVSRSDCPVRVGGNPDGRGCPRAARVRMSGNGAVLSGGTVRWNRQTTIHCWFALAAQVDWSRAAPLSPDAPATSRHLPLLTLVKVT